MFSHLLQPPFPCNSHITTRMAIYAVRYVKHIYIACHKEQWPLTLYKNKALTGQEKRPRRRGRRNKWRTGRWTSWQWNFSQWQQTTLFPLVETDVMLLWQCERVSPFGQQMAQPPTLTLELHCSCFLLYKLPLITNMYKRKTHLKCSCLHVLYWLSWSVCHMCFTFFLVGYMHIWCTSFRFVCLFPLPLLFYSPAH